MNVQVRPASPLEEQAITRVHRAAFGESEASVISELVADLSVDATARPLLSLVAAVDDLVVGHILFSRAHVIDPTRRVDAAILAPLSVHPQHQGRGMGGQLIREGLQQLRSSRVELVFVLGHPGYYPRYGFVTAGAQGFEPPYPLLPEQADAWMVQELRPGILGQVRGTVVCAKALDQPRYWRE